MKTNQIDVKRIDSITSDYAAWVKRVEFQREQIELAQSELEKLNKEIANLKELIKDSDIGINNIPIESMREFFEDKNKVQIRLSTLNEYESQLTKRIKKMETALATEQSYITKNDFENDCWAIIYEGLVPTFDKTELRKLVTVGIKARKSFEKIMNDLGINELDAPFVEQLVKQFNLPN